MISRLLVALNNRLTRWRRPRVAPANLLVLLPRCLQEPSCERNVGADVANCRRCGRCRCGDILDLADAVGFQVQIATGGKQAVAAARRQEVRAIVSVACATELIMGIVMVFPKPVLAVLLNPTETPCRGTGVDVERVREATRFILEGEDHGNQA
ncbi:MAG: DUF116 domain-containing protein [Lentisphaerae bacterium]|nr:DUF116 domain-containing protein [Lentisphaerota bacterium]